MDREGRRIRYPRIKAYENTGLFRTPRVERQPFWDNPLIFIQASDGMCGMTDGFVVEPATQDDVSAILAVLAANREDPGLFSEPESEVRSNLIDFLVARDARRPVVGCAALHRHSATLAEILGVAVLPAFQGRGIGLQLVQQCEHVATSTGIERLWLATVKPAYFTRFGYKPISRWELPASVLLRKRRQVFQQPLGRWLPALLGRHTFMQREIATEPDRNR